MKNVFRKYSVGTTPIYEAFVGIITSPHVLVNSPHTGYGIFIENMPDTAS